MNHLRKEPKMCKKVNPHPTVQMTLKSNYLQNKKKYFLKNLAD